MTRPLQVARFVAVLRELGLARISESDVWCLDATINNLVDEWGTPDDFRSAGAGELIFIWQDIPSGVSGQRALDERFVYPMDAGCLVLAASYGAAQLVANLMPSR